MQKKVLTIAAVLGLFLGGIAVGQFFSINDLLNIQEAQVGDLPDLATKIAQKGGVLGSSASAAQVTQVNSELNTRLQYIQIRQNAEIIRLLNVIAAKK